MRNVADERESNPLNAIYMMLEVKIAKNTTEVTCSNLVIFAIENPKPHPS